jgi:hypothetical protein
MIAEIEDDSERSDTAAIRTKIQQAIRYFQPRRFWFNETRSNTFSTVAGQSDYDIATVGDFYTFDALYLIEGNGEVNALKRRDYRWSETLEGNVTSNQPYSWAYVNKTVRLYPPPDAVYTMRPTGHIKVAAPATDGDAENEWMLYAYDLIMYRARASLEANRWADPNAALMFKQMEQLEFTRLMREGVNRIGTGETTPTQF